MPANNIANNFFCHGVVLLVYYNISFFCIGLHCSFVPQPMQNFVPGEISAPQPGQAGAV